MFIENCTGPGIRSTSGQSPAAGQAAAGAQGGAQQAQQEGPEPERRSGRRRRWHGKPRPRHRLPVAASNRLSTRRAERPGPRVRLCPALPAPAGRVSSGHGLGARRGRSSGAAGMKRPASAFPANPLPHSHASTVKKPTSLQNHRRRRRRSFSSAPGGRYVQHRSRNRSDSKIDACPPSMLCSAGVKRASSPATAFTRTAELL